MSRIEWKDEFNTGIKEIDEQHKHLMQMINNLITNFSQVNIHETVMQMEKYAQHHFEFEEDLMLRCGCKELEAHKKQHNMFHKKARQLAELDYAKSKERLVAFNYLCGWLANHILIMDMKYKECFLSGYNSSPD